MNLLRTTSNTSFKWPTTFGTRHHSPPYSIFCASPWGLHPNVTFCLDFQMRVPKIWTFISFSNQVCFDNVKAISYIPQKRSFQHCIAHFNLTLFNPCFQRICDQKSNSQFDSRLFYIIIHAKQI
jgi:hypothetical protein